MIVCIQSLVSMQNVVLGARLNTSGARVNSFFQHQITAQSLLRCVRSNHPICAAAPHAAQPLRLSPRFTIRVAPLSLKSP